MAHHVPTHIQNFIDIYVRNSVGTDNVSRIAHSALREALLQRYQVIFNKNQLAGMVARSRLKCGCAAPPPILKPHKERQKRPPKHSQSSEEVKTSSPIQKETLTDPTSVSEFPVLKEVAAPAPTEPPSVRPAPALKPAKVDLAPSKRTLRVVTCQWPLGEPGTRSFKFCDSASESGKPYCGEHAKLAYVKVRDRREDAN